MSTSATASSSFSSTSSSTPPTTPTSTRSPSPPRFSNHHHPGSLSTSLPSLNRALLRAYNLALSYTTVTTPQHQKLTREATALVREVGQDQRRSSHQRQRQAKPAGAREERTRNFNGWQQRYSGFGKNDPPIMPPAALIAGKKRDVEAASLDEVEVGRGEVEVEGGEGGGKRVRRLTEKAREELADLEVEKGGKGKKEVGKRRKSA